MTDVALPAGLALIMASLGLSLRIDDFTRIVRQPRGILLGLANLIVLSPVLAFGIATLYGLDPLFAVGLVLLGASPGGTMANLLTHLARGDTALSVSMTALSSLLAVITVPLYLALAVSVFDAPIGSEISVLGVVLPVFAITIVPLVVGMLIHARAPTWTARSRPTVGRIAMGCFVLIVIGAVVTEIEAVSALPTS
jgi:BASS family bile acid:Na+ symporter